MKYLALAILILVSFVPSLGAGECAGGICRIGKARAERQHGLKRTPVRNLLRRH